MDSGYGSAEPTTPVITFFLAFLVVLHHPPVLLLLILRSVHILILVTPNLFLKVTGTSELLYQYYRRIIASENQIYYLDPMRFQH
jgi:hypothetical protein